jgi:hypothetical protein
MDRILFVGRDLLARSRIENATLGSGADVIAVDAERLIETLRDRSIDAVIVDLDGVGRFGLERIRQAGDEGLLPDVVIGYFSHVDAELGAAARTVGIEPVPRGKFWRTLPDRLGEPRDGPAGGRV